MLGANLGSLLYGDVPVVAEEKNLTLGRQKAGFLMTRLD